MTARGVRLNNPGNVRHSKDKWQGMADEQTDHEFVRFKSPEYGIRAIARILLTYQDRGLDTIGELIHRYAPPIENDTSAYVENVSTWTGISTGARIDVDDIDTMEPLVRAIIRQETGAKYPDSVVQKGLLMAGIHGAEPKPLAQSRTIQGSVVTAAGGGLAAAAEIARQADEVREAMMPALNFVTWLTEYGIWVALAVILGAAAWIAWSRYEDRARVGH